MAENSIHESWLRRSRIPNIAPKCRGFNSLTCVAYRDLLVCIRLPPLELAAMFHRSVGLFVEFVISSPDANNVATAGARTSRSFLAGVLALTVALSAQAQTLKTGLAEPRPILFVPNHGQAPARVLWQAQGRGFEASFRTDGFALRITGGEGRTEPLADGDR